MDGYDNDGYDDGYDNDGYDNDGDDDDGDDGYGYGGVDELKAERDGDRGSRKNALDAVGSAAEVPPPAQRSRSEEEEEEEERRPGWGHREFFWGARAHCCEAGEEEGQGG